MAMHASSADSRRIEIRQARPGDAADIKAVLDQARQAQRDNGFVQWADGYPSIDIVNADIRSGLAFRLCAGGRTAGYAVLVVGDDGYSDVEASFGIAGSFAVVHRLAIADGFRGHGLAAEFMLLLEAEAASMGIAAMRVDTGEANTCMLRLMHRLGYIPRGLVAFRWGPRMAFEKALRKL